jgi:hypothetical protein
MELHHIIPKCMGGCDSKENLAWLTPEEHYIAHQLLIKIYPNENKLIYAARMMTCPGSKCKRNNKMYGWLRRKYNSIQSFNVQKGYKNNPNYGMKNKKHTEKTKQKMSLAWKPSQLIQCPNCNKIGGINNMKRYHFDKCGKSLPKITCPFCNKSGSDNIMKRWHFDNCKFKN